MIGVVVVSHSAPLARAAVDLALEMVPGDRPRLALAAGTADGGLGTDAARVAEAIGEVAGDDGVLVLMDLGSAVLSAELALELLDEPAPRVVLSSAPFVEGVVAALVTAAGGASLDDVVREAESALDAKRTHLGEPGGSAASEPSEPPPDAAAAAFTPALVAEVEVLSPEGLHARPAAALATLLSRFDAAVDVESVSTGKGPVPGRSVLGLISLGARHGEVLRITATGSGAADALAAVTEAAATGFGEL